MGTGDLAGLALQRLWRLCRQRAALVQLRWGLDGHPHHLGPWLFAWEQKLRRLPSLREWSRAHGFTVGRRGHIPRIAIQAYRRAHRVLTPEWVYRRHQERR